MSEPRVSIGLPVYNGESYLGQALESVLNQTFADFELIVSDNASTDRTGEICRSYAARDDRIRLFEQSTNLGAAPNFNFTVSVAKGVYFKWMAHDDVLDRRFLERCVAALDADASAVLSMSAMRMINGEGRDIGPYADVDDATLSAPRPSTRFRELIRLDYACFDVFGLIRKSVLQRTNMIDDFITSDRALLVDLGLSGTFIRVPEELFFPREHAGRSTRALRTYERVRWWNTASTSAISFPRWRLLAEYVRIVRRADVSGTEKWRCYGYLMMLIPSNLQSLGKDLAGAALLVASRRRRG